LPSKKRGSIGEAGDERSNIWFKYRFTYYVKRGQARRKLLYLHRARTLQDLRQPPGNQLEALKGDRKGQYGIHINDQWRMCFRWENGDVYDVEIADYH